MLVLALAAAAALGLSACGGGSDADLLPGSTASEINSNLDQVRELANEGECVGAEDAVQEVSDQVDALSNVDPRLQEALREGTARLAQVVAACEEAPEEETSPAIEPAVEPEEEEEKEKPRKTDKEKPDEKADEAPEETTTPELPEQAEGKAKGHEKAEEEVPPVESEEDTSSGGVGPAAPVGGE
jgi:outer membrane biosynthesis protein TonB